MDDLIFECPKCKQRFEAPPDMAGQSITCPSCDNSIRVPYSKKLVLPVKHHPSPISKFFDSRYNLIQRSIQAHSLAINEHAQSIHYYREHSNQYFCSRCDSWVDPHFDYEHVSSGGGGFMMPNGLVVVRQESSTREFIRCSRCGIRLDRYSGGELANQCAIKHNTALAKLKRLQRFVAKWHKLDHLADKRPRLATCLRFHLLCPWFIPVVLLLILSLWFWVIFLPSLFR